MWENGREHVGMWGGGEGRGWYKEGGSVRERVDGVDADKPVGGGEGLSDVRQLERLAPDFG